MHHFAVTQQKIASQNNGEATIEPVSHWRNFIMKTHPHQHETTKLPASPSESLIDETKMPIEEDIDEDEDDAYQVEPEDSIRIFWVPMAALHTITIILFFMNQYWFVHRFAEWGIDSIYSSKIIPISIMVNYCARAFMILRGNDPVTHFVNRLFTRQGRKRHKDE